MNTPIFNKEQIFMGRKITSSLNNLLGGTATKVDVISVGVHDLLSVVNDPKVFTPCDFTPAPVSSQDIIDRFNSKRVSKMEAVVFCLLRVKGFTKMSNIAAITSALGRAFASSRNRSKAIAAILSTDEYGIACISSYYHPSDDKDAEDRIIFGISSDADMKTLMIGGENLFKLYTGKDVVAENDLYDIHPPSDLFVEMMKACHKHNRGLKNREQVQLIIDTVSSGVPVDWAMSAAIGEG